MEYSDKLIIPHNSQPLQSQNFTHMGYSFTLITRWNSFVGYWNVDIYDNRKREWLTQGEPLSIGAPCLSNLDLPFYFVLLAADPYTQITREALGDTINLYIVDRAEYNDAILKTV